MESDAPILGRLYKAATCLHRRRIRRIPLWCTTQQLDDFKKQKAAELAELWDQRITKDDSLKVIGCFAELADSLEIETCYKLEKVAFVCIKKLFQKIPVYRVQNPCVIEIYKLLCLLCDHMVMKHNWDEVLFVNYQTPFMEQCEWFCSHELLHRNLPYATKFLMHVVSRCRKRFIPLISLPSFDMTFFSCVPGWSQLLEIIVEGFNKMNKPALLQHMPDTDALQEFVFDLNNLQRRRWPRYEMNSSNVLAMEILTIWCIKTHNSLENEVEKLKNVHFLMLFDHFCLMCNRENEVRPWASLFFIRCLSFKKYAADVLTMLLESTNNLAWCRRLNIYYELSYCHLLTRHHIDILLNVMQGPQELQQASDNIHRILQDKGVHPQQLEHVLKTWMDGKLYKHLTQKPAVDLSRFLTCNRQITMPSECSICSSDENSLVILAPCGHVFCVGCYPLEGKPCHMCKTGVKAVIKHIYT